MRTTIAAIACGLGLAMMSLAVLAQSPSTAEPKRQFLFKDSRGELADARAKGKSTVSLVIASARGMNARVAAEVRSLGGEVRYREDSVDYLRVVIAPAKVEALVALPQIQSADIQVSSDSRPDEQLPRAVDESAPSSSDVPWPPTVSDHPLSRPFSAYDDLDISRLLAESPTFDGRGVVIAHVEGFFDLLRPEFQQALSLDGKPVPKLLDYLTVSDPREQDDSHMIRPWVAMQSKVTARDRSFEYDGRRYGAPKDGAFRLGRFDESKFYPRPTGFDDLNRDGNPPGSSRLFGVLWKSAPARSGWIPTRTWTSATSGRCASSPSIGTWACSARTIRTRRCASRSASRCRSTSAINSSLSCADSAATALLSRAH
jgi:hypothetical protein